MRHLATTWEENTKHKHYEIRKERRKCESGTDGIRWSKAKQIVKISKKQQQGKIKLLFQNENFRLPRCLAIENLDNFL